MIEKLMIITFSKDSGNAVVAQRNTWWNWQTLENKHAEPWSGITEQRICSTPGLA